MVTDLETPAPYTLSRRPSVSLKDAITQRTGCWKWRYECFSLRGLDGTSLRLVVNPTPAFDILYDRMLRPYTKPSRGLSPA